MAPVDARTAASNLLNSLAEHQKTLDTLLAENEEWLNRFSRTDRSFFNNLVFGVLRWRARLDGIIERVSKTPLQKIDPAVLNLLRIGVYQLIYLDRVPASAAVNTTVEIVKRCSSPWVARYVNGVLRTISREAVDTIQAHSRKNTAETMADTKSFPVWLIKRWIQRFGYKETGKLCDTINDIPAISIRVNSIKTERMNLKKEINRDVRDLLETKYSPVGLTFRKPKRSISNMVTFRDGWFQVQDEAAQLVTMMMNPMPGEIVLDACAGFGGKTGHIAQMMQNSGKITAVDSNAAKLKQLHLEMKRLGATIVETKTFDLTDDLSGFPKEGFDRILLDAPCSGIGVIRRNPDIKWTISKMQVEQCSRRQVRLLNAVASMVKVCGTICYCVCSTEPEENDHVVKQFLAANPKFAVQKNNLGLPAAAQGLLTPEGFLRTNQTDNLDGFFAVCFQRKES